MGMLYLFCDVNRCTLAASDESILLAYSLHNCRPLTVKIQRTSILFDPTFSSACNFSYSKIRVLTKPLANPRCFGELRTDLVGFLDLPRKTTHSFLLTSEANIAAVSCLVPMCTIHMYGVEIFT
jgi:hypothetical protein